jgi:hypothetical protein
MTAEQLNGRALPIIGSVTAANLVSSTQEGERSESKRIVKELLERLEQEDENEDPGERPDGRGVLPGPDRLC